MKKHVYLLQADWLSNEPDEKTVAVYASIAAAESDMATDPSAIPVIVHPSLGVRAWDLGEPGVGVDMLLYLVESELKI